MMERTNAVRRELLSYLATYPQSLRQHTPPSRALAELCLSLGNVLLWIHPLIAPDESKREQPLGEHPDTLWSLGKQFRAVGQELWDAERPPATTDNGEVEKLRARFDSLEAWLARALGGDSKPGNIVNLFGKDGAA